MPTGPGTPGSPGSPLSPGKPVREREREAKLKGVRGNPYKAFGKINFLGGKQKTVWTEMSLKTWPVSPAGITLPREVTVTTPKADHGVRAQCALPRDSSLPPHPGTHADGSRTLSTWVSYSDPG